MTGARGRRLVLPIAGGLLLAASTPPAWFPGAELLVLVGLALWFRLAASPTRPLWHSYLLGCVHMAWFSWSVHHVLLAAYAFIVVVGGLYYVAASAAVRALPPRFQGLAFAAAVAGVCWLRAVMPDIGYPHGQPCHAMWRWPVLLGSVTVGGEALANALLAALAATAAGVGSSWRLAMPSWGAAWRAFAAAALAAAVLTATGAWLSPAASPSAQPATVDVAAIEPGFHPMRDVSAVTREQWQARMRELITTRLIEPTRELLAGSAPDVVLWPESALYDRIATSRIADGTAHLLAGVLPPSAARLVLGANVAGDDEVPATPAALLLELPAGRVLAHQEKRQLVPGGERQPFLWWLPDVLATWLRDAFTAALGSLPDATPGRELPPLTDARGVPFGALLCYDNAYPGPASAQVAMGARWLCVLSNEAWYEGGGELAQLMAMTVVRALEVGTPIVRCTQDGWSGLVDAGGNLVASLPPAAGMPRAGAARILRLSVPLGSGRLPPMAWLRSAAGPIVAVALGLLLLHGLWRWARLRAASTASHRQAASGSGRGTQGSGS